MIDPKSPIAVDRDVLSGTPVFRGTRVPVQSLFDHLEAGDSIDRFLDQFPSVGRGEAIAVLQEAKALVLSASNAAS